MNLFTRDIIEVMNIPINVLYVFKQAPQINYLYNYIRVDVNVCCHNKQVKYDDVETENKQILKVIVTKSCYV